MRDDIITPEVIETFPINFQIWIYIKKLFIQKNGDLFHPIYMDLLLEYFMAENISIDILEGLKSLSEGNQLQGEILQLLKELFAEMIFIFGDVHCDPHEVRGRWRRRSACAAHTPGVH